jgi:hypothetical protein
VSITRAFPAIGSDGEVFCADELTDLPDEAVRVQWRSHGVYDAVTNPYWSTSWFTDKAAARRHIKARVKQGDVVSVVVFGLSPRTGVAFAEGGLIQ